MVAEVATFLLTTLLLTLFIGVIVFFILAIISVLPNDRDWW